MSFLLTRLPNGWAVDQAILSEQDRVVVIRFGDSTDPSTVAIDDVLASIAPKMQNFAVVYAVDITEVPDFNAMCVFSGPFSWYSASSDPVLQGASSTPLLFRPTRLLCTRQSSRIAHA